MKGIKHLWETPTGPSSDRAGQGQTYQNRETYTVTKRPDKENPWTEKKPKKEEEKEEEAPTNEEEILDMLFAE